MSDKLVQQFDREFSKVRTGHVDAINRTKSGNPDIKAYNYSTDEYSESVEFDNRLDMHGITIEETMSSEDAKLSRKKTIEERRVLSSVYEDIDSHVQIPTTEGTASYDSTSHRIEVSKDDVSIRNNTTSETTIVRHDADGNEVYRFKSTNPDFVNKVGAVAAKQIIHASQADQSKKAA